jgi:hypothetical protein
MRRLLQLSLALLITGLGLGVLNLYIDGRIGVVQLLCSIAAAGGFMAVTVKAITRRK